MAARNAQTAQNETARVLIAMDESKQARYAFDWYIENCHTHGNQVYIVHVAEPPYGTNEEDMNMSGYLWSDMIQGAKQKAKIMEEKYTNLLREKGVCGRAEAVFHRRPGEAIVELAKEDKSQFIVMGTRGLGMIRRTILGSVSDYVLHHVHCPVLICRQGTHGKPFEMDATDHKIFDNLAGNH